MAKAGEQVDDSLQTWVSRLRERGVTWARIGGALGMARQSAWERFSGEE
jgi:ATP-dependent Clp protease ATP-binding subunit ClpX